MTGMRWDEMGWTDGTGWKEWDEMEWDAMR